MAAFFSFGLGIGREDCKDSPILFLLRTTRWLPPMGYKGNILQIGSILPKRIMPNYRKIWCQITENKKKLHAILMVHPLRQQNSIRFRSCQPNWYRTYESTCFQDDINGNRRTCLSPSWRWYLYCSNRMFEAIKNAIETWMSLPYCLWRSSCNVVKIEIDIVYNFTQQFVSL